MLCSKMHTVSMKSNPPDDASSPASGLADFAGSGDLAGPFSVSVLPALAAALSAAVESAAASAVAAAAAPAVKPVEELLKLSPLGGVLGSKRGLWA